ncbi:hypothetical protein [Pseudomonas phage vB_PaeP_YL1]
MGSRGSRSSSLSGGTISFCLGAVSLISCLSNFFFGQTNLISCLGYLGFGEIYLIRCLGDFRLSKIHLILRQFHLLGSQTYLSFCMDSRLFGIISCIASIDHCLGDLVHGFLVPRQVVGRRHQDQFLYVDRVIRYRYVEGEGVLRAGVILVLVITAYSSDSVGGGSRFQVHGELAVGVSHHLIGFGDNDAVLYVAHARTSETHGELFVRLWAAVRAMEGEDHLGSHGNILFEGNVQCTVYSMANKAWSMVFPGLFPATKAAINIHPVGPFNMPIVMPL